MGVWRRKGSKNGLSPQERLQPLLKRLIIYIKYGYVGNCWQDTPLWQFGKMSTAILAHIDGQSDFDVGYSTFNI